ncbi:MAG: phosphate ABC transporter, permease protein PstA, partial [Alphaproteobacteria bacterium]|nr:phosphate ABC transporter, permease protein PstA [Alphaproteobacteria bacterium]
MALNHAIKLAVSATTTKRAAKRRGAVDLAAHGEPFQWSLGGALAFGVVMIVGFLAMVFWHGFTTFWPRPIDVIELRSGAMVAGEPVRSETFRPNAEQVAGVDELARSRLVAQQGGATRTLYRTGNFDIYNDDFRWVADFQIASRHHPDDMLLIERREWGVFIGWLKSVQIDGLADRADPMSVGRAHEASRQRWRRIQEIERDDIGAINFQINRLNLDLRRVELTKGKISPDYVRLAATNSEHEAILRRAHEDFAAEVRRLRHEDDQSRVTLVEIGGKEKTINLSTIVRMYPANGLSTWEKLVVYGGRWWEFLSEEPREANTEGGIWPAIFGTFAMTLLMVVA